MSGFEVKLVSRSVTRTGSEDFVALFTHRQGPEVTLPFILSFKKSETSKSVATKCLHPPSTPPLQVQYTENTAPIADAWTVLLNTLHAL